jgi:uncharacterized membrane protein YsdA (DUF1294 family)
MINLITGSVKVRSLLIHLIFCSVLTYIIDDKLVMPFIAWWFIVVNIFEFFMFGKDKLRAKMNWRRTPESTFLIMGFLGAFPGIFLGRVAFRHKTSKKKFYIPMWILFFVQLIITIAWIEHTTVKGQKVFGFIPF